MMINTVQDKDFKRPMYVMNFEVCNAGGNYDNIQTKTYIMASERIRQRY